MFQAHKVVATLPTVLAPNAIYAVRVGAGFDLYISDSTGTHAHKVNAPVKTYRTTVVSDADGVFTVDYSSMGFSSPPKVMVSAQSPVTDTIRDRVWASLRGAPTTTTCSGYTIRGALIVTILLGGAETVRTAPNTSVDVIAIGE